MNPSNNIFSSNSYQTNLYDFYDSDDDNFSKRFLQAALCALGLAVLVFVTSRVLAIRSNKKMTHRFMKKVENFIIIKKNSQQIATELFKDIPRGIELNEIVDFIFKKCRASKILPLIDALSIAHPSFALSPFDKIRRHIVEEKFHITNSSLIALLKKTQLNECEEKVKACYDLAYRMNNPYVYQLSQTPVLPEEYSLNFLWVNLNPQDRLQNIAQNIFKDGLDLTENAECIKDPVALRQLESTEESQEKDALESWKQVKKSFTYKISKWADSNPRTQINLWYDSALVTRTAQQNTSKMMSEISRSRGVDLSLRDIRHLPNISGEIENSLHPGTHVYYRVDILKALIADYLISSFKDEAKYCVVSDIDVEPMTPQQLFDQRTMEYLSSKGYVFNRVGLINDFENSFFIFNKEKKDLQKIHHETVIQQTALNLNNLRKYPINKIRLDATPGVHLVFQQYPKFLNIMGEQGDLTPRKVVVCPPSQFNCGGDILRSEYRSERFRFIGDSNVPYTVYGRNCLEYDVEGQIKELINWQAEPLEL